MKKLIFILFILILTAAGLLTYRTIDKKLHEPYLNEDKEFEIEYNTNITMIITKLRDELKIHPFYSGLLLKVFNTHVPKAGSYIFEKDMSINEIVNIIKFGREKLIAITLPEGLTIRETAEKLQSYNLPNYNDSLFIELAYNEDYINNDLKLDGTTLEGYLYPETYHINPDTDTKNLIKLLVKHYKRNFDALNHDNIPHPLTDYQKLILASIIEKETRRPEEMPVIASVYYNRLKLGRLLECDATVQYGLPNRKKRLYYKDLDIDTPYNTYIYPGLPPTPIGNPGKKALRAIFAPDNTDYLYFVARKDGYHIFSRTLKEHNRARQEVKRNK